MTTCTALYCTSRKSKKIEGITFHRYPKDPKRLEEWLGAVGRSEDWRPKHHSTLCSLHFEEDAFDRCSTMRVYLKPDAVPTIFPVAHGRRKITKKSKKQPRDPITLQDACLLEPLVILPEGAIDIVRPKRVSARHPAKRARSVTPIAVEKVAKLKPWSENDTREAQVTKESENQPKESPIAPEEPCSGVESVGEVLPTKESEEHQDIVEIAFRNAMDGLSPEGPKAPSSSKDSKSALGKPKKKAPGTADGATDSVMKVNMVCPHCQKVCKVCLSIKPRPPKTNSLSNLRTDNKPQPINNKGSFQNAQEVRKLKALVLRLQKNKLWMRKKVKILQQSVRRLKVRNERLQNTLKETHTDEDLVVIGTINGVLNNDDDI